MNNTLVSLFLSFKAGDIFLCNPDQMFNVETNVMYLQNKTFCLVLQLLFRTKTMGGSPGDVSENPVTQEKRKKGWRMSCDVGEATDGMENEL